jgi:cell division protein FtsB
VHDVEQAIEELLSPSLNERLGKLVARLDKMAARVTTLEAEVATLKEGLANVYVTSFSSH